MNNLTLSIPGELRARMDCYPEINWSEVARQAITEKTRILDQMQKFFSKSTVTEEDAIKVGRQIKKRVWQKYKRA